MILIQAENIDEAVLKQVMELLNVKPVIHTSTAPAVMHFPELEIHTRWRQVYRNGQRIPLTQREYDTLLYLAANPGFVYTKNQIYQNIHYEEGLEGIDNIIYCLIRGLRKKLEPDPRHPKYIHTVRGVGYKFKPLSEE